jgi:NADPH2:quinone reductase
MKAMRVHAWGEPPILEEIAAPSRRAGHSLVRMQAATVGHIDRTVWGGAFLRPPPLPYTPGVEAAGVVVASERFDVGQRVWLRGAGLGTQIDGTWCELIDAPDAALGLLPPQVDAPLGSAFFSPCTSAWVALHEIAQLRAGEHVLVSGATGAVGSIVVQLALQAGARVTAALGDAARAGDVPAGAEIVVTDPTSRTWCETLRADLLVDTVGGALLAAALPAVVPGGRAVLVGYTGGNTLSLELAQFLQRDVALLPLNMFRREAAGRAVAPELLARLADGRLRLQVTSFALSNAAMALQWITERGHRGRAVLVPHECSS